MTHILSHQQAPPNNPNSWEAFSSHHQATLELPSPTCPQPIPGCSAQPSKSTQTQQNTHSATHTVPPTLDTGPAWTGVLLGPQAQRCSVTLPRSCGCSRSLLPPLWGKKAQALFEAVDCEEHTDPGLTQQGWAPQGDGPSQDGELRRTENSHQSLWPGVI